jgi:WD40 repeat protein
VKIVRSRELAAVALNQLAGDPLLALLIAIEAERAAPTAQSEDALRRALVSATPDEGAFRHPAVVNDARLSPDGAFLLTAGRDRLARLWEIATQQVLTTFRGHQGAVTGIAFSPNGGVIATASADRTARIWDIATGQSLAVLSGHASAVTAVAFSPDGRQLVTGGADRTVRVWDAEKGDLLAGPFQQTAPISRVAFLPAGQIGVLTAQAALRLDPRDGAALGEWREEDLPSPVIRVEGLALYGHAAPARVTDADVNQAVSVGADGTVRLHLLKRDALLNRAQRSATRELTCEERVRYLNEARRCA